MGAYPALDIKTPQQPDILEKYGQLMQLKNAQNEQALAPLRQQQLQQSVQSGGLQIQQQQQALKDQQATTAGLTQWDGKDYNDLYPLILKNGGSASAVFALKKQALDQQHVAAETFKNQADAGKAQVETLKQKNDILNGSLSPLTDPKQIPDEQLPQALDQTLQDLSSKGLMDPQGLQAAEKLKQTGDPNAIRQGIGQFIKSHMALTQVLEEAHKTALEANQQAERQQAQAALANTEKHQAVEEKQGQQRIGLEGARLAFEKQRQGTQDQNAIEQQAQQIAKYDVKGLSQARNNPFSRAVMARVYEINPGYSDEGYATNQDFLSSKGKANAQVQSLNKLSAHLGELQQASDQAGFSPVGFTGAGKSLRLAEQLFGKEDVKFLSGAGVGTEGELNALIEKTHSPVQSVRSEAINTLSKFTADAARQLGDQYERGTKLKFDPNQHFTPDTVNLLNTHGGTSARSNDPFAQFGGKAH